MNTQCTWTGQSGRKYVYYICSLNDDFNDVGGNYIFAKEVQSGIWSAVYIGQTNSFKARHENHEKRLCAIRNGATHIHAHTNAPESARITEEYDLIKNYQPPCNTQGK